MALFAYQAKTSSGDIRKGELDASSVDAAKKRLRQMQLSPISVKKKGGSLSLKPISLACAP